MFCNDESLAISLRSLRLHGKGTGKYDNVRIGLNSRLDTLQAAILLEKLRVYPIELAARQALADHYGERLSPHVICPLVPSGFKSAWAQYTVRSQRRDELLEWLSARNVPAMIYYARGMHQQGAFSSTTIDIEYPISEQLSAEVLSIPFHPYLGVEERDVVVGHIQEFFAAN